MKTLIIYATKYGSTKKAAEKLKEKIVGEVVLVNIMEQNEISLEGYDNVILGGSIYMGKIQKKLTSYINKNIQTLLKKRVGLFICGALNPIDKARAELYDAFPKELYEKSLSKEVFGYEFYFEKMGFIEKKIISSIMGVKSNVSKLNDEAIENLAKVMCSEGTEQ